MKIINKDGDRAYMMKLFPPGPQRKVHFLGSFAIDHILHQALPVEEYIEIITFDIDADDIEHKQNKAW
jgi:hypothetical protein